MDPGTSGFDDRAFDVSFSSEGLGRLRGLLDQKLRQFMGDYSDDTLVEYIIVLLKNGKRKSDAVQELKVFLEDDSSAFVAWLWHHLFSNMHLYVQAQGSLSHDSSKVKPVLERDTSIKIAKESNPSNGTIGRDEFDSKKLNIDRTRKGGRKWGTSMRDEEKQPPFLNSTVDNTLSERITHKKGGYKRSVSPQNFVQGKRRRYDVQQSSKWEMSSTFLAVDAPRRLLQSAVRDAVTPLLPSNPNPNPNPKRELKKLKRLRSVVSRPGGDSGSEVHSYRTRSAVGLNSNAFAAAVKAAAEAAEDVLKSKSGNVFDRLSCDYMIERHNKSSEDHTKLSALDEGDYNKYSDGMDYDEDMEGKVTVFDREADVASDFASDNDGYAEVGLVRHHDAKVSRNISSIQRDESVKLQCSVAQSTNDIIQKASGKDQDELERSHKIVNISVNVNTWKPPEYQVQREASLVVREAKNIQVPRTSEVIPDNPVVKTAQEVPKATATIDHERSLCGASVDAQKSGFSLPGSYSVVRPMDDAQSRTVFVNNVHFAASKDSLSRHFNKFGEVLKVIILTDPASGKPKGSAYIEFVRKESADLALSLNGTSFMSRILKVVQASSVPQEAGLVPSWPRIVRGPAFVASRMARTPMSRGIPSSLRARLPVKQGARSLQWKRDASAPSDSPVGTANIGNTFTSSGARSLTYIRNEQTTSGNN